MKDKGREAVCVILSWYLKLKVWTALRVRAVISPDSALNGICNELIVENVWESWTVEGFDSLPGDFLSKALPK